MNTETQILENTMTTAAMLASLDNYYETRASLEEKSPETLDGDCIITGEEWGVEDEMLRAAILASLDENFPETLDDDCIIIGEEKEDDILGVVGQEDRVRNIYTSLGSKKIPSLKKPKSKIYKTLERIEASYQERISLNSK